MRSYQTQCRARAVAGARGSGCSSAWQSGQMGERIQKVLAHAGVASRRAAEEMMRAGRVSVNGVVVRPPGALVDPEHDAIAVDGQPVRPVAPPRYYLVHKPAGVVS